MKKLSTIILLLAIPFAWISCDKDIQINDEYKDITIVYGLINPNDSVSYLRIEKAFLSDGVISQAAQIADSNLYNYKLDVSIKSDNETIRFDTMTIYNKENKEDDIFYAPEMLVYYAVTKDLLNTEDEYSLKVKNPKTGEEASATTKLINGSRIPITYPRPGGKLDLSVDNDIEFESTKNARIYQVTVRFNYAEEIVDHPESRTYHYVDMVFQTQESQFLNGGEEMRSGFSDTQFFTNLENNISPYDSDPDQLKVRYYGDCETIVSIADETLYTYIEINKPSASLVIDRPEFTNLENAYGIFASRSSKSQTNAIHERTTTILKDMESLNFARSMFEFK